MYKSTGNSNSTMKNSGALMSGLVLPDCAVSLANANGVLFEHVYVMSLQEKAAMLLVTADNQMIVNDRVTLTVNYRKQHFTRLAKVKTLSLVVDGVQVEVEYIDHIGLNPADHCLDMSQIRVCPVSIAKLPANIAFRQKALPFLLENNVTHVACSVTVTPSLQKLLERFIKTPLQFWQSDEAGLLEKLKQVYGNQSALPVGMSNLVANESQAGAVNIGDDLLFAAYMRQASDIHIDPGFNGASVRFRTDGQLETYRSLNSNLYSELVNRLKVMSKMDIAEKRVPQDGRFGYQFSGNNRRIDVRVATLPTKYGERVTMRLLAAQTDSLILSKLGFSDVDKAKIEQFLLRTQGLMIMTGPTGSGKTTTLYASIRMLLEERRINIITVEDPIEFEIEGIAQTEVDEGSNLTFAKALRSILRHDPDVIMIGEIRDKETADIAIKAALTGHMVLGTLHANSAAATVTRLLDMQIEPYLVAAALRLTIAQRLLRRLCTYCRIQRPLTRIEALVIDQPQLAGQIIYDPVGCIYCGNKGYSGRIGLYEVLELNTDWARAVAEGEGEAQLVAKMREAGIKSLLDDAVMKMMNGQTSIFEVIQIASSW